MATFDLNSQSTIDWQKAQERYQKALGVGYDPQTAASLYLAPIDAKWKIISAAPDEFQDPQKFGQINSDFENAQSSAVQALTGGSSPISIAANQSKWMTRVKPESALEQLRQLRLDKMLNPTAKMTARQQADLSVAKKNYIDAVGTGDATTIQSAADALDRVSQSALPGLTAQPVAQESTISATTQPSPSAALTPTNPDELSPYFASIGFHGPTGPVETPSPAEALTTRKPVIYITGGKGNTVDKAGADAAWQAQFGSLPQKAAKAEAMPAQDELVSVINPQGKRVRIKKEQLDDALRQGYQSP